MVCATCRWVLRFEVGPGGQDHTPRPGQPRSLGQHVAVHTVGRLRTHRRAGVRIEKVAKLAQKLGQLQPFSLYSHINACANLHFLVHANTFLARTETDTAKKRRTCTLWQTISTRATATAARGAIKHRCATARPTRTSDGHLRCGSPAGAPPLWSRC